MVFAIHNQHESATGIHVSPHPGRPLPHPLGCPRALALGALLHARSLHWSSVLHTVIYKFQCYSLTSSHLGLTVCLPHFAFKTLSHTGGGAERGGGRCVVGAQVGLALLRPWEVERRHPGEWEQEEGPS